MTFEVTGVWLCYKLHVLTVVYSLQIYWLPLHSLCDMTWKWIDYNPAYKLLKLLRITYANCFTLYSLRSIFFVCGSYLWECMFWKEILILIFPSNYIYLMKRYYQIHVLLKETVWILEMCLSVTINKACALESTFEYYTGTCNFDCHCIVFIMQLLWLIVITIIILAN